MKSGDIRVPWLWPTLIALSLLVAGWVLYLTSYKTFYYDEWDFIVQDRPWDLNLLFLAHNEHWVTIPILVWKVLFVLVGIRSYVPYEAALLAVHVAAVLLLFQFVRRHSGELPAFGAALILLVLGGGGMDIVWAFQIEFIGSVAFGLLALLLIDGQAASTLRVAGASAALLCSLMCSGVGVAFLGAVAAWIAFDRHHRRFWPALVVPAIAFGVWFIAYGAGLPGTPGAPCPTCAPTGFSADIHKGPIGLEYFSSLAMFVLSGLAASTGAIFAVAGEGATATLVVLAVLFAFELNRQKSVASWQLAMFTGLVGWFALVGLGRASRGPNGATDSHYLYIGAVFLLPLIAGLVREFPSNLRWWLFIAIAFAVVLFANAWQLRELALSQTELMASENAKLQAVEAFRGAPDMDLDRSLDEVIMPQLKAGTYLAAIKELGSPVARSKPDMLSQLPHQPVDQEMVNLFGRALSLGSTGSGATPGATCHLADSATGSTVDFEVPGNQSISLRSTKTGTAFLLLGFLDPPASVPLKRVQLPANVRVWLHVPDTGERSAWQLRIQTLDVGELEVCSTVNPRISRSDHYVDQAASFTLGPGWSSVSDMAASSGRAAKAAAGAPGPQGAFGNGFLMSPGAYDIWYRVRVTQNSGTKEEMTFGIVDIDTNQYVGKSTLRANQTGPTYSWVLVASNVSAPSGHLVRFQANIATRLSTEWYIDGAIMIPAGSPAP